MSLCDSLSVPLFLTLTPFRVDLRLMYRPVPGLINPQQLCLSRKWWRTLQLSLFFSCVALSDTGVHSKFFFLFCFVSKVNWKTQTQSGCFALRLSNRLKFLLMWRGNYDHWSCNWFIFDLFTCFVFFAGTMNYARFLTAVSAARKPSPIRMLSKLWIYI